MTLRTLRFSLILFTGVLMAACSLFSGKQSDTTSIPEPLAQTVREWAPAGTPRGVILGLHSFGDFGAAFEQLGPWFAEAGYVFVAYDQAGFGDRLEQGRWAGEKQLVDEAVTQIRRLHQTHAAPLFVLGESLGGAVAILAAQQEPDKVAGLMLAGPAVREGIRFRYGWNAAIATAATTTESAAVFTRGRGRWNRRRIAPRLRSCRSCRRGAVGAQRLRRLGQAESA